MLEALDNVSAPAGVFYADREGAGVVLSTKMTNKDGEVAQVYLPTTKEKVWIPSHLLNKTN